VGSGREGAGYQVVTHDPLCDADDDPYNCRCDLITKVRADEKAKWTHVCPDNNCCMGTPE